MNLELILYFQVDHGMSSATIVGINDGLFSPIGE